MLNWAGVGLFVDVVGLYVCAALEKDESTWADGTAVYYVASNPTYARGPLAQLLATTPAMYLVATRGTVAIERYAPALMLLPLGRVLPWARSVQHARPYTMPLATR